MFIRAYLRASTKEQNAERARESLIQFAAQHGQRIAAFYIENVSGATLHRPELMRLIAESGEGDIVLVEQIDRLARLKQSDWDTLKQKLASKRLANAMMLDMLAAVARKDYDDRRRRQSQGIAKAKSDGKYNGRQPDLKRHQHIASLLKTGHSYSDIQDMLGCSRHLIATISKNIGSSEQ